MVLERGLEPLHLSAYAPQAHVSANFTTRAHSKIVGRNSARTLISFLPMYIYVVVNINFFRTSIFDLKVVCLPI